jgi:prepilin-type N-terminal cleavage/methylation domain-containing protein
MIINTKRQKGLGLIELIASLAIIGILSIGLTTFVIQSITLGAKASSRMQATMLVENAGFWVSRDVQMAENLTLGEDAGFPLQLAWLDTDQNDYKVTYNVTEGQMKRSLVKNDGAPVQTLIMQSVNSAPSLTYLSYADGLLTFNITSTYKNSEVSRNYKIKKRLDLN